MIKKTERTFTMVCKFRQIISSRSLSEYSMEVENRFEHSAAVRQIQMTRSLPVRAALNPTKAVILLQERSSGTGQPCGRRRVPVLLRLANPVQPCRLENLGQKPVQRARKGDSCRHGQQPGHSQISDRRPLQSRFVGRHRPRHTGGQHMRG